MPTDIEIARSVTPLPITEVAKNAGVDVKHLIPYGFDKAKVDYSLLNEPTDHQAKLVLVTAINPTPAGGAALYAKDGTERRLTQGHGALDTATTQAIGQTDGRGGLALARGRWVDSGHEDELGLVISRLVEQ